MLVCMELQEGIHSACVHGATGGNPQCLCAWSYRRESIVHVCMELQEGIHSACVHGHW